MQRTKVDALDGNIGRYSRLEQIKEVNALAAAVSDMTRRDKDDTRKRCKYEATSEQALRKANKKQAAECSEEARRLEVMGYLIPLMETFETGEKTVSSLETLSGKVLKEILKYIHYVRLKGIASMKKVDMVNEIAKRLVLRQHILPAGDGSVVFGTS